MFILVEVLSFERLNYTVKIAISSSLGLITPVSLLITLSSHLSGMFYLHDPDIRCSQKIIFGSLGQVAVAELCRVKLANSKVVTTAAPDPICTTNML